MCNRNVSFFCHLCIDYNEIIVEGFVSFPFELKDSLVVKAIEVKEKEV